MADGKAHELVTLAKRLPLVLWLFDAERNCVAYVSPAYETVWGRSCAALYERPEDWMDAIHPDDRERVQRGFEATQLSGYEAEFRIVRPDGSVRWIHDRGFPIVEHGVTVRVAGIATDITDRVQRDARVRLSLRQKDELLRLSQLDANYEEALCEITETVARCLDVGRVSAWRYERNALVCEDLFCADPGVHERGAVLEAGAYPAYFAALEGSRAVDAVDAHTDSRTREFAEGYLEPLGIRSMLDVPIRIGGALVGVVCLETLRERQWSEEDEEFGVFVTQLVATARASRERRAAQDQLHRLNDELERRVRERTAKFEEANRELESFTYTVSHDLRAPLRHVRAFIAMLRDELGDRAPDVRGHLDALSSVSTKMARLIDDLLAFSRLGKESLASEPVDLGAVVARVLNDRDAECRDRRVRVDISDLPAVNGDPSLLAQLFANLVDNALKYTRSRVSPRIAIKSEASDADRMVVVSVADNGVGFDMRYVGKLFGVFERLHDGRAFEGSGIGLAIVRRIVERHGGRVWIEAKADTGATVFVELPAA